MRRRSFLALPGAGALGAGSRDWGTEWSRYRDPLSGLEVIELTGKNGTAANLYYHFSNFTADNRFVIFTSDRSGPSHIFRGRSAAETSCS